MSNEMKLFQEGAATALSTKFNAVVAAGAANDLGDGIRSSYGIVSIKGGKFRIKYKGNDTMVTTRDLQGNTLPAPSIDVVIVKANPFLNKQYYAGKYAEGSNSPPDCYSLDGKVPSAAITHPQHTSCALCPKNQFGSLIGENGVKQKACRDTKKLAIVPLLDIRNQTMGGAMLFRVPPSALKDLSTMADTLKGRGYPYNSVAVRIAFDQTTSHPKPTFTALRPLTDDEADAVLEMFDSDSVSAVLADNDPVEPAEVPVTVAVAAPVGSVVPQAPVAAPVAAVPPPPPVAAAPPPPPPPVAAPAPAVGAVAVMPFNPAAPAPPLNMGVFGGMAAQPAQPLPATLQLTPETAQLPVAPQAAPAPAPAPKARKPRAQVAPPAGAAVMASNEADEGPAPEPSQLNADIASILSGLQQFGST